MVFEDDVGTECGEGAAEYGGVLLNDRCVGDDVDDATQVVTQGVSEGEGERGERLAPAGGHGERE